MPIANRRLCGAKKTRKNETCPNLAIGGWKGNGRCKYHGGYNGINRVATAIRAGRYTRVIPERLLANYTQSLKDPNILSLHEDIALIDSRLNDLLKRVDTGEAGVLWTEAKETYVRWKNAMFAKDQNEQRLAMENLENILKRGSGDFNIWADIHRTISQRVKLVESERRRMIELQQTITSDQAMAFVLAVVESVKRNVADEQALRAISEDIARLVGPTSADVVRTERDAAIQGKVLVSASYNPTEIADRYAPD